MHTATTNPDWIPIPFWHTATLTAFGHVRGLFRFLLDDEIMFIGWAAGEDANLGNRIVAYRSPKGAGRKHHAGRLIYERREDLDLQIAVLDMPTYAIKQLALEMIETIQPRWRVPA
jgi:hypothetical protein